MKKQKYSSRLPALRLDKDIYERVEGYAYANRISLAEAHRQLLAKAVAPRAQYVPVVGEIREGENGRPQIILHNGQEWKGQELEEAA